MLVHQIVEKASAKYGDKIFIREKDKTLTFSQLKEYSRNLAYEFIKMEANSTIGILLPNSIDYIISYFAVMISGCIAVPINPNTRGKDLENILKDSKVKAVIGNNSTLESVFKLDKSGILLENVYNVDGERLSEEDKLPGQKSFDQIKNCSIGEKSLDYLGNEISSESIALILYTSGTVGHSKGVCLSQNNLVSNMEQILERIEINGSDNMLVIIPLYYSYGNSLILSHLYSGASLSIAANSLFPNQILSDLAAWNCTSIAGVATNFITILKRSVIRTADLDSLRYVTLAGEVVPDWILKELLSIKEDLKIYVMYGQTEATARISILCPDELNKKTGSVGRPLKGITVRIVSGGYEELPDNKIGEVLIKGPNIMKHYWNEPELTAGKFTEDGYMLTGDYGKIDEDGYLYVLGRKDDMIKVGGERVFPLEIEKILLQHKSVKEVAVIGTKSDLENESIDHYIGQSILAYVVCEDCTSESELIKYCKENLAKFKVPRKINIVNELPKTKSGKIRRTELRENINKN